MRERISRTAQEKFDFELRKDDTGYVLTTICKDCGFLSHHGSAVSYQLCALLLSGQVTGQPELGSKFRIAD